MSDIESTLKLLILIATILLCTVYIDMRIGKVRVDCNMYEYMHERLEQMEKGLPKYERPKKQYVRL